MLEVIRQQLASHPEVTLVAVSKFHPVEALRRAYDEGQRAFGESRVQELTEKAGLMPSDVEWHFIGHLQRNKVKPVVALASLIHSIDSERLLEEVNRQATAIGRRVDVLLQLHVAQEETKFGFAPDECLALLQEGRWRQMEGIRLRGIMCMGSNTDDEKRIRQDFGTARQVHEQAASIVNSPDWNIRSWGMSGDYLIAIEEGATHIRVGSMIFGERY